MNPRISVENEGEVRAARYRIVALGGGRCNVGEESAPPKENKRQINEEHCKEEL